MACVYMKCEVEKINIGAMIRAKNEVAFVKVHESWSLVEGDRTLVEDVYWEGSSLSLLESFLPISPVENTLQ